MIAARQIFLGRGGGAKLPYDAEVEYLESTGTQWIVTDTPGESGMTLGIDFVWPNRAPSAGNLLFGIYQSSSTEFIPAWRDGVGYVLSAGYGTFVSIQAPFDPGEITSVVAYMDVGEQWYEVNGVRVANRQSTYRHTITTPLSILGTYTGGSLALSGTRIYHAFARVGDDMRLDVTPVRFTNELGQSEGAMYDRVSKKLFRNQGTGAFIYGNDK
jgi:hypothetical protein